MVEGISKDQAVLNGLMVESLQFFLAEGEHGLKQLGPAIKKILQEEAWKYRIVSQTRKEAVFNSFTEFVVAEQPEGLGADIDTVKRLIKDDPVAGSMFEAATQGKNGRPAKTSYIIQGLSAPKGTSSQAALRRLRKQRPDLLEQVKNGKLSPHAAAIEAGWRKRMIQLDPTVDGFVKAISKHLTPKQIDDLKGKL